MPLRSDAYYMNCALREAKKAFGLTSPNPMVGAVVVDGDGRIVGRGYHHAAGLPHAEPNALADAADKARGATLFVTLEPCCTTGRTPPCTDAIIRAGIRRVVIGALDSNPKHMGRAVTILRDADINVDICCRDDACVELNRAFFHWINARKPYVLLKMAMTLDGKIATYAGDSKWVSGELAREHVQTLRRWADAIMVGGRTVELDDPSLTVRSPANWPRQPQRLVWTSRPLPPAAKMLSDDAPRPRCCKPQTRAEWDAFLKDLGSQNITALLIEGGGNLAANALKNNAVDEIQFIIAPKLLLGQQSRPVTAGDFSPQFLREAIDLSNEKISWLGRDLLYTARIRKPI